jgi:hypothetical protein
VRRDCYRELGTWPLSTDSRIRFSDLEGAIVEGITGSSAMALRSLSHSLSCV